MLPRYIRLRREIRSRRIWHTCETCRGKYRLEELSLIESSPDGGAMYEHCWQTTVDSFKCCGPIYIEESK